MCDADTHPTPTPTTHTHTNTQDLAFRFADEGASLVNGRVLAAEEGTSIKINGLEKSAPKTSKPAASSQPSLAYLAEIDEAGEKTEKSESAKKLVCFK